MRVPVRHLVSHKVRKTTRKKAGTSANANNLRTQSNQPSTPPERCPCPHDLAQCVGWPGMSWIRTAIMYRVAAPDVFEEVGVDGAREGDDKRSEGNLLRSGCTEL